VTPKACDWASASRTRLLATLPETGGWKVKDTTRHHGASLFVLARKAGHVACFEEKAKMSWTPWSPNIDDAVAW
jgi:hypothetical protein